MSLLALPNWAARSRILSSNLVLARKYHTTPTGFGLFHESHPKSGYQRPINVPKTQLVRSGLKQLKEEIKLWSAEWKDKLECDPEMIVQPGDIDTMWSFETEADLDKWVTTSDQDNNEGLSTCSLTRSAHSKGLFSGVLSTRLPKDGIVKRAGYCNIRTIRATKSFKRDVYYNWFLYTHLVLRIRGDGRTYMVNLSTPGYFDITWNDMYSYPLHTRGGPYWQVTKIPFSKFFLASKGRVQDKQSPVPRNRISNFGISIGDRIDGPFRLEIDYVGLEFDPSHTEEFAYEMYKVAPYTIAH